MMMPFVFNAIVRVHLIVYINLLISLFVAQVVVMMAVSSAVVVRDKNPPSSEFPTVCNFRPPLPFTLPPLPYESGPPAPFKPPAPYIPPTRPPKIIVP